MLNQFLRSRLRVQWPHDKRMKSFPSIIISILAASTLRAQTYQTFQCAMSAEISPLRHLDIPLLAGEILEVKAWIPVGSVTVKVGDVGLSSSNGGTITLKDAVFAGPLTISVDCPAFNTAALLFTYKITTVAAVAEQVANAQAIAIPADTIAPVDVILESSTDLMTWIAALPGNYPVSPAKRFFRVRTVLH